MLQLLLESWNLIADFVQFLDVSENFLNNVFIDDEIENYI